jgi:TIR domain-containing protein
VKSVFAPLLGSGAGGLQEELVANSLRAGFTATAAKDASLVIHVLSPDVYERLRGNRRVIQGKPKECIRVFISHTSKINDALEWVKSLALYLIDQGIQARLDCFHLRRGMDLPQWMCNELALANNVIVVCDEAYKQKADGRLGGVGWETMIIQGDMSALPPDSTKYQVVVRTDDIDKGLPLYLKTRYAYHAPASKQDQEFREQLVKELLDLPLHPTLEAKEFAL